MSIRSTTQYDNKEMSGYIDFGTDIEHDHTTIAKDALVFLFVCLNGAWKIPVGYFLGNGIKADQKANLIQQCLCLLHETGVRVIALTCDGATVNFTALSELKCNLKLDATDTEGDKIQSWFPHPVTGLKVFVFLDPCHMIKLIRNIFGDLKTIVDGLSTGYIKWKYITELYDLHKHELLHLANKLRSAHIHFRKQKMKVRLATQLFSKSVSQALEVCQEHLHLPQFKYCTATIAFLSTFNDLFDIFNSKNMRQFNFKQPINSYNYETIMKKLTECKKYIMNLKLENGVKIIHSTRKTGLLGFIICINSLEGVYNELCIENNHMKYIPRYKFSQDHIELFFGCIRSRGGWNNNPSAINLKSAIKQLLVHSDIRDSGSGNCIPLEHIPILHVSSAQNNEQIINSTIPSSLFDDDLLKWQKTADVVHDHSYFPDIRRLTELSSQIITYIAGCVVRHLRKSLHCHECVNALSSDDILHEDFTFIRVKSRGNLLYPSSSVMKICRETEKVIRFALHESGGKCMKRKYTEAYLASCVLFKFSESNNLFLDLTEHAHDQNPLQNHIVHLIKAIARKYVRIRLYHIAKQATEEIHSKRTFRNHLTLFEGQ